MTCMVFISPNSTEKCNNMNTEILLSIVITEYNNTKTSDKFTSVKQQSCNGNIDLDYITFVKINYASPAGIELFLRLSYTPSK